MRRRILLEHAIRCLLLAINNRRTLPVEPSRYSAYEFEKPGRFAHGHGKFSLEA
jgi:hypothetical protein